MKIRNPIKQQYKDFINGPDRGPVMLVNLLKFRERADYGEHASTESQISGRDAYGKYMDAYRMLLERNGARVVLFNAIEGYFIGDGRWDAVWINAYPDRATFVKIIKSSVYKEISRHRDAGLDHQETIITNSSDIGVTRHC